MIPQNDSEADALALTVTTSMLDWLVQLSNSKGPGRVIVTVTVTVAASRVGLVPATATVAARPARPRECRGAGGDRPARM